MPTTTYLPAPLDLQLEGPATFEEVLEFYTRSGFLYPAKLAALGDRIVQVAETWRRLLDADGDVFKMVLRRKLVDGLPVVKNSVCAFEHAPGVFQVQHLVSSDRHERTGTLAALLEMTDWLPTAAGFTAYQLSYRPDNPGASQLFGGLAATMPAQRTHTHLTSYRLLTDLRGVPESDRGVRVRPAGPGDGAAVDQLWATAHPAVPDWLAVTDLNLDGLSARYRAHGLERRRTVLVAEHAGTVCGTITCWWSSEGMNFSFLESAAAELFVADELPISLRRRIVLALIGAALREYAASGRSYVALVLGDEVEELVCGVRALSEVSVKWYANVTVSVEDIPASSAYWRRYYSDAAGAANDGWRAA